jgi:hypothetical protein
MVVSAPCELDTTSGTTRTIGASPTNSSASKSGMNPDNFTTLYSIDPLSDPRWEQFLARHPSSSVFHSPGWLQALRRTYGYEPIVFTTSAPGQALKNGIAFCRIQSWLTGHRLVSLPFCDHCEPLLDTQGDLSVILSLLQRESSNGHWKYIEIRPLSSEGLIEPVPGPLGKSKEYILHRLDLRPEPQELIKNFHMSCVRRQIKKAEKEGLTYEAGHSETLLVKFYQLLLLTRRRHQIPPQPLAWFRNLIDCLDDKVSIRVASWNGRPIASILTLSYKDTVVYKYGCSDENFNHLAGTTFLFWRTIQDGKRLGALKFDLGRSDPDNAGLIAFKDHWGAAQSRLLYFRFPAPWPLPPEESGWMQRVTKRVFGRLPDSLLTKAGEVLYRHIG